MPVTGMNVAGAAIGALLCYSGIKGTSLGTTFTDLTKGQVDTTPSGPSISQTAASAANLADSDLADIGTVTPSASSSEAQGGTATANMAIAKSVIQSDSAYAGWDEGTDWTDLVDLWNKESGWSNTADNPASGAYGIAQALPPTKYPAAGQAPPTGTSNATAQIQWGLEYIAQTYGNPQMAWAHEVANNWY